MKMIKIMQIVVIILFCSFGAECMNEKVTLRDFNNEIAKQISDLNGADDDTKNACESGDKFKGQIIYYEDKPIGVIYMTGDISNKTSDLKIVIHPSYRGKWPGENVAATAEVLFIKGNPGVGIGIAAGNIASLKTFIRAIIIGNLTVTNQSDNSQVTLDELENITKNRLSDNSKFEYGVYVNAK